MSEKETMNNAEMPVILGVPSEGGHVWPWDCIIYVLISTLDRSLGEITNEQNGKKRQTTQILSHDPVRGRAPDPGGAGGGQDT